MKALDSAKVALEMLANLCQEGEWRWIDGMLLGGCLAYGLEDYYKALEWYRKIISVDPRLVLSLSYLSWPFSYRLEQSCRGYLKSCGHAVITEQTGGS